MRKLFIGAVTAAVLGIAPLALAAPALADWKAVAAVPDSDPSYYWWGTGTGWDEESARANAVNNCESNSGRTCYETRSVPSWWYLVISNCGGYISTGGSKHGYGAANSRAAYNANYNGRCRILKKL